MNIKLCKMFNLFHLDRKRKFDFVDKRFIFGTNPFLRLILRNLRVCEN